MNKTFKITSLIVLLCTLFSFTLSCSGTPTATPDTDGADSSQLTNGVTEDTSRVLDVPEMSFDGYEFSFFTGSCVPTCPYLFTVDNASDEIDMAMEKRNAAIEDKYDIVITETREVIDDAHGNGATFKALERSWNSNEVLYDAAVGSPYDCCALSQSGMLADLRDYGYINLSKAWWDQNANESFTVFGRTFITTGDINYIDDNYTYAIAFNKDMLTVFNLEDPYALVREGAWTYDKLFELSRCIGNCVIVAKRKKGGIIEEEQKEGAKKRRCPKASFFEVI